MSANDVLLANLRCILVHELLRALLRIIGGVRVLQVGLVATEKISRVLPCEIISTFRNLIAELIDCLLGALLCLRRNIGVLESSLKMKIYIYDASGHETYLVATNDVSDVAHVG